MKKTGFIILAVIILAIILYVTIVIKVIEFLFGAILFIVAAVILWIIWNKVKSKVEEEF
ncbi:hypothetical protein RM545_03160 [Zunongwangia sp. F260]|jgi:threonine/homoserine/homoserine lactone efflux protein|uniref:Uncharacterized protein n=3 Tax=Autumnicola TaxID=3160927 RepID=A0ABU3CSS2_9FLAO|nr:MULTISPECIES: hypothetical protein [unclassified Zunongwangia]MDT0645679.1 hypothetical protein [Zunongwangia sp. F260]MDT0649412.1 hypothetical protein [Zunongwangia sp. F297]MDT0685296.1 hypothetical protein [Zunongwangia sp. F225]